MRTLKYMLNLSKSSSQHIWSSGDMRVLVSVCTLICSFPFTATFVFLLWRYEADIQSLLYLHWRVGGTCFIQEVLSHPLGPLPSSLAATDDSLKNTLETSLAKESAVHGSVWIAELWKGV